MVSAIVCVDENFGIGYNNELLFHIKEDLELFKELTTGNIIIMGRKTYDSLPKKPLPNRINMVITNNPKEREELVKYLTLDEVKWWLDRYAPTTSNKIFIIGGESIYKELLPYCECIYVTKVYKEAENVDTYFPNIDEMPEWELIGISQIRKDGDTEYQFGVYDRVNLTSEV